MLPGPEPELVRVPGVGNRWDRVPEQVRGLGRAPGPEAERVPGRVQGLGKAPGPGPGQGAGRGQHRAPG